MFNACRSKRVRRGRGKLNRNLDRYATGAVGTLLIRYLDRSATGGSITGENGNTIYSFQKFKLSITKLFSFLSIYYVTRNSGRTLCRFTFAFIFLIVETKEAPRVDLNAARQASYSLARERCCERSPPRPLSLPLR